MVWTYNRYKWREQYGVYEGVRPASWKDFRGIDDLDVLNIEDILDCMWDAEFLVFEYFNLVRLVAPFVLGVSRYGNALMRGYQVDGFSRRGASQGWRVFQVREMSLVGKYGEYFFPEEYGFNSFYPWIWAVFAMVEP